MCPYKKEKLRDEVSEEENMACGVEPSLRSRRHRYLKGVGWGGVRIGGVGGMGEV